MVRIIIVISLITMFSGRWQHSIEKVFALWLLVRNSLLRRSCWGERIISMSLLDISRVFTSATLVPLSYRYLVGHLGRNVVLVLSAHSVWKDGRLAVEVLVSFINTATPSLLLMRPLLVEARMLLLVILRRCVNRTLSMHLELLSRWVWETLRQVVWNWPSSGDVSSN